ncbi:MAG: hypothetical protein M1833_002589 [Piccolia ochrophora]|nr:MAG: hypothetical protein M1833_002589 [Piccolia ochrophora]
MKAGFGSRRKGRRVGQEDLENDDDIHQGTDDPVSGGSESETTPTVKRPTLTSHGSSRPKKKSSLRLSFGPGQAAGTESHEDSSDLFLPKKSSLSRQAIEKNAARTTLVRPSSTDSLPIRAGAADRPSYSKEYLDELKSSTPSTPKDLRSASGDDEVTKEDPLGVVAKFGMSADILKPSSIPTDAEIREKKGRRARLAHDHEYIGLDDDEESRELALLPKKKWEETRLVREDEDLGEGFDEFVEDGKITLGKKAEKEQEWRRRAEMQDLINEAEGPSDDESDASDAERRAAYEAAQTRAGTYGSQADDLGMHEPRPTTPPKMAPLPDLAACVARLEAALSTAEFKKTQRVKHLEELAQEKAEIMAREVEIQRLLKEAGENYERLRLEAGLGGGLGSVTVSADLNGASDRLTVNRGLESLGNTPGPSVDGD